MIPSQIWVLALNGQLRMTMASVLWARSGPKATNHMYGLSSISILGQKWHNCTQPHLRWITTFGSWAKRANIKCMMHDACQTWDMVPSRLSCACILAGRFEWVHHHHSMAECRLTKVDSVGQHWAITQLLSVERFIKEGYLSFALQGVFVLFVNWETS